MFKSRLTRGRHAHIKFLGSIAVSGFAAVLIVVSAEVTILGAGVSAASPAATSPPRRIGQTPLVTARAVSLGALAGTTAMRVDVELLPRDPAALANFATAVSTPGNPLYKHYITTFEFASTFGPTAAAISAVTNELESDGLQLGPITANHLTIPVTGASSQFEKAFSIGFDRYQFAGRVAYANTQAPLVSGNVAPYVLGVVGLNNLYLPHRLGLQTPRGTVTGAARPQVVTGGPQPCATAVDDAPEWDAYTADQLASAYGFSSLYGAGDEGSGVTVAIFELEPNLTSDIEAYQSCYGTSTTVNYIKEDGGTGTGAGEGEAALDIEDVIGLAPKATIDVYQAPNTNTGLIDNYTAIVTSGAQVVSTSWGLCEAESGSTVPSEEATLFQESATEGQSVFAAAGDSGSSDCETSSLAVDDPASQPYVTGVGGTSLTALGPPPTETVWNESSNDAGAGGGGISSLYTMPSYQSSAPASLNVLNTNSSGTPCGAAPGSYCREVPDVSADADPYTGYLIYYDGGWTGIGGTSAAAPLWAAYTALADGSSACVGKRVGFANPALYDAAGSSYSSDFHDITSGNDRYTPDGYTGGLYPTGTGYDMASGLGTPNGGPLASTLCDEANPAHTVSVTNPGSQTSTVGTAVSLQITATDSASGQTLTYSATGLPAGLSISSSSGLISGTPTTATSYSVTVTAKDTTSASGSASFTWTVNPARPTLTTTPRPTSVTLGKTAPTLKDSAILSGGYNPTGRVTFTLYYDGAANPVYTSPAVGLSKGSASASYTLRRTSVQFAGMYQWDATYSGDANNDSASDINDPAEVVTVTAPGELAFGGGWYTPSASVGKASFGFVVAQGPSSTYTGQLNDVTPGKWWFQAKVTSFGLTGRTRRLLAGTGSLYSWNSTLNKGHGGWQLVRSGVTYKATADAGTNSAASFGIKISYTLTPERTALPNSSPIALTRGRIFISLIPSSDAERSGIPDHPVE
jgi:kumamolisin